eukprot:g148.t1
MPVPPILCSKDRRTGSTPSAPHLSFCSPDHCCSSISICYPLVSLYQLDNPSVPTNPANASLTRRRYWQTIARQLFNFDDVFR